MIVDLEINSIFKLLYFLSEISGNGEEFIERIPPRPHSRGYGTDAQMRTDFISVPKGTIQGNLNLSINNNKSDN